jgi:hypothetical protein
MQLCVKLPLAGQPRNHTAKTVPRHAASALFNIRAIDIDVTSLKHLQWSVEIDCRPRHLEKYINSLRERKQVGPALHILH